MRSFHDEQLWSTLCTLWTVVFMIFVVANFFLFNRYEPLILPLSAVYAGVLTLYAGTKEFDRWYDIHDSRHPASFSSSHGPCSSSRLPPSLFSPAAGAMSSIPRSLRITSWCFPSLPSRKNQNSFTGRGGEGKLNYFPKEG